MKFLFIHITILLTAVLIVSCVKDETFTDNPTYMLSFSEDSVKFDTVFTTIGSATKELIVYNTNSQAICLPSVHLASGGTSGFRINVDGLSGTNFSDVEILHKDSIYVFVEVTLSPEQSESQDAITDSIQFTLPNGKVQNLILQAYGQNVIIMKAQHISSDTVLSSNIPYLIYDSLVVDQGVTLEITPGTTLYFHDKASLEVHGTIKAKGTLSDPITFRGDRLDKLLWYVPYDHVDALWNGIHIYETSLDNELNYCDIHSGNYGVRVDGANVGTSLLLTNSIIHNVAGHGLDLFCCNTEIGNCQITNAKGNCVNIIGGSNQFYFNTIAQFYPWDACGHALYFANVINDTAYSVNNLGFEGCIITGMAKDELFGTRVDDESIAFNYEFKHCLVLTDTTSIDFSRFVGCVFEGDTAISKRHNFVSVINHDYSSDFHLDSISRARGIAVVDFKIPPRYLTDHDGWNRPELSDAGCYQFLRRQEDDH